MKKVIPKFSRSAGSRLRFKNDLAGRTEDEEARFWDTHSPLDYPDEFSEVKEPFKFAPNFIKMAARRRRERKRI